MSDSTRVAVSYVEEVTYATTPNSAFTALRITGGSMTQGLSTVRSNVLRSDAQRAGSRRVAIAPRVNYNIELEATTFDVVIRDTIRCTAWSTAVAVSSTAIAAVSSGNQYTSGSVNFTTQNIAVGQWIYVAGFTTAANNGWKKVTAIASGALTVTGGTLVDESVGDTVTMKSAQILNGTAEPSHSIQENLADLTNKWLLGVGMVPSQLALTIAQESIITGSITWDGSEMTQETAASGNGSVTAAAAREVMSEVDSFGSLWIDNVVQTYDIVSTGLQISVPTRRRKGLGNLGITSMGRGALEASGTFELYHADATSSVLGDMLDFTKFAMAYDLVDTDGRRYLIEFPSVALTDEPGNVPGNDQDVMLSFNYAAEPGGAYGAGSDEKTIQICRVTV